MFRKIFIGFLLILLTVSYGRGIRGIINESEAGGRFVPKMLNYQGYLTDTEGIPIDSSLDMKFRIYDSETGGTVLDVLWTEDTTGVSVERGIFNALLGSVNPIPDSVFTGGTNRWLELIIGLTDTLSPRTRITAMGYAYMATHADTAEYAKNAVAGADNDWVRGPEPLLDTVLFTANYLGIARGGAGNELYGDSVHTHTNLGNACITGVSGEHFSYLTIAGGSGNRADSNYSAVVGGYTNRAQGEYSFIGGGQENSATGLGATISGGLYNTVTGYCTAIGGGEENSATGLGATISGGYKNNVIGEYGEYSTIGGGQENSILSATGVFYGTIAGGGFNTVEEDGATIGGGSLNTATGYASTICGGQGHSAVLSFSAVAGGESNIAYGQHSFVGGGSYNNAQGDNSFIGGGYYNNAQGDNSFIGGGHACTTGVDGDYSVIAGGDSNTVDAYYGGILSGHKNVAGDELADSAAVVVSGWDNSATAKYSFIGGGENNTASGDYSFVGGGLDNYIGGDHSVILCGNADTITDAAHHSFLFGFGSKLTQGSTFMVDMPHIRFGDETNGYEFPTTAGDVDQVMITDASGYLSWVDVPADTDWTISGNLLYPSADYGLSMRSTNVLYGTNDSTHVNFGIACTTGTSLQNYKYCTVAGGYVNAASGDRATVAGGENNTASGDYSFVGGGLLNTAGGDYSFAVGRRAKANNSGSFVWADDEDADFATTGNDQFLIRAAGGVGIGTNDPNYTLDVAGSAGFDDYLYHNNDDDTYLSFLDDRIDLYAGNVQMITSDVTAQDFVVINEGGVDVDFRVESDNDANALFVDGSDDKVGIGTSSPTAKLDVNGSTGYNQIRMRTSFTPSGTSDTNGNEGDVAWDDSYIYVKTSAGWARAALSTW